MPARRQRQQAEQQEGPVWQPVHRFAFVQRLMRSGYLTHSNALDIFEQLTGSDSAAEFEEMIQEQNLAMNPLNFRIKVLTHPQDERKYVGFVNTLADDPSKHASLLNHGQREFFKHVLADIASDDTAIAGVGCASSIQLLNMDLSQPVAGQEATEAQQAAAAQAKKLTMQQKQDTLLQLVNEGWLQHSSTRSGFYCIGPRSFMELGDLLMSLEVPESTKEAWANFL